ncbi:hypothetical protein A6A12_1947 [Vibrio anguillarum]|nr:hypothetical protein A6A12_1947 [Vibrio anguillarum]
MQYQKRGMIAHKRERVRGAKITKEKAPHFSMKCFKSI